MQEPLQAEYPTYSHGRGDNQPGNASPSASTLEHFRNTTYQGIQVGGDSRAHFGDRYQQNHGLVINANNVDLDERVLRQLIQPDLHSPPTRRTFGLCLGQAPQIDQDAFIGRRAELQQLQEWFSQDKRTQRVVSIFGMGGLGKTQLSLAYAREQRDQYTSLFWVNAKDELSLRQSFCALASVVLTNAGTQATNTSEEKTQVELVRRWLSEDWNHEWLMIFDNYDDPNLPNIRSVTGFDIRSYFPHRAQGHILLTTRSPKLAFSKRLTLRKFEDIGSSLNVLTQRAARDLTTDVDARRLAVRLDGLPLALATAGTYLAQTNVSCTEYLQAYESAWTDLYGPDTEELLEYEDRTLSSTWNISFDQVCRVDADAAELLKFWVYFNNKDIWYELIRAGADLGPAWMGRITANKIRFDRAMTKLQDYSLVEVIAGSYSIHLCVHDWMSERFGTNQTDFLAALKCNADSIPPVDSIQYWSDTNRLLLHIDRLNNQRFRLLWDASTSDQEGLVHINALGTLLYAWGDADQAESMLLRAFTGCERELGPDHQLIPVIFNNIGMVYKQHGDLEKAEEMYKRAIERWTKAVGPDSLPALNTIGNLSRLYQTQGKLEQAEKMHVRVLAGTEKVLGSDHPTTLNTMADLASIHLDQGKLTKAEEALLHVLGKQEEILGHNHMSTLRTVLLLGVLHRKQNKLVQSEIMYLRVLIEREIVFGPYHSWTLDIAGDLAVLYRKQGKLDEADAMLSRILSICQGDNTRSRLTRTRIQDIIESLVEVLARSVKVSIDSIQEPKHQLARLIRLAETPNHVDNRNIIYYLARALFGMKDEENYLVAFSQVSTALCDSCDGESNLIRGHHICRQCFDADLCDECMANYTDESLTLSYCRGHEFLDVGSAVLKSMGSPRRMSEEAVDTWIDRLKERYPLVTDS